MFKILSTTLILILGGLGVLWATSGLMDLFNMPETVAVVISIVLMGILWLLIVPYSLKFIIKRYIAAFAAISQEKDSNA